MLSRRTTASLAISVALLTAVTWVVYRHVPPEGGAPRSRRLLGSAVDGVEQILFETGGMTLVCQRRQGTWWLVSPIMARADDARVQFILDTLALAPVHDVIGIEEQRRRGTTQRDYGLLPPRSRVLLQGALASSVELRIGVQAVHGQSLYAGFTGSGQILVTDPAVATVLPKGVGDLRDRQLLPHSIGRLRRFELRPPGQPLLAVERDPAGVWWLQQPERRRASSEAVVALLDPLANGRVLSFVAEGHAGASEGGGAVLESLGVPYGCHPDESPLVARFWFANGQPIYEFHELIFGKPSGNPSNAVYAMSTEERLVFTVDASVPTTLRAAPENLRDRHLWFFPPSSLERLRLRGEAGSVTLETRPEVGWIIAQPVQTPVQLDKCLALVDAIVKLRDLSVTDAEPPARYDWLVELSGTPPMGVHTALVSRVGGEGKASAAAFDWYLPAQRITHRVAAESLPPRFGEASFLAALRSRQILELAPETVAAVSQQLGTNRLRRVVRTADGGWRISDPAGAHPRADALDGILTAASRLHAESVAALVPDSLDGHGLVEPVGVIVFELREADFAARVLLLGGVAADGGRYALLKGQESVFVLGSETAAVLLTPLTAPAE